MYQAAISTLGPMIVICFASAFAYLLSYCMTRILIPQALATAVPNLVNLFVGNVKGSTLAYMISVHEMMGIAVAEANKAYRYIEVYVITALIYWGLCFVLEQIFKKVEIRQNRYKVRT